MPTGASWVEGARRSVADVGHLLRLRAALGRRSRGRAGLGMAVVLVVVTALSAVLPALLPGAGDRDERQALDVLILLSSGYVAFLAVAITSAVASGGGRELLPREQAVAFPVSPTTDHLGALLLAPLNIAWMLQAWLLIGATAYGLGLTSLLLPGLVVTFLWVAAATAIAQVAAWTIEAVRRGPGGLVLVRLGVVLVCVAAVAIWATGNVTALLDRSPTVQLVVAQVSGFSGTWARAIGMEALLLLAAVILGALPAHLAARRPPRDEHRLESRPVALRRMPRTDLAMLVRIDRASVWRTVPMRRGLLVLAVGPGAVAIAGDLPWESVIVLPGLVASGCGLLFGVNAWSLDGRGALWRENLPVAPSVVFAARAWVLAEFLLLGSLVTLALAAVRGGVPSPSEAVALACVLVVVVLQVLGLTMRWSLRNPHAVDLRSARATPAPPTAMVGYSTRLALGTTVVGMIFSGLARLPDPGWSLLVAVLLVAFSLIRLERTRRGWADPRQRSRVVAAVAA